ncbi:hypothetical protein [Adhaeretor mobilis]|uniref:hypothetical protein n=1 Tax=Adhaeretor mobilis TaxID=1930276 RepID=UPI001C54DAE5|nr:hypothetical protein [Adhaeretor mobilis]
MVRYGSGQACAWNVDFGRFWGLLFETEVIDTAGSKSAQIAASFDAQEDESDAR